MSKPILYGHPENEAFLAQARALAASGRSAEKSRSNFLTITVHVRQWHVRMPLPEPSARSSGRNP
jgi:hypothetical protein